jgi:dimethylglycine dehydrogenase
MGAIPAIHAAVMGAGAVPFGMFALNALRMEKGYRAWKGDLSTDYSLLQGGLERFIDWDKDFRGKAALLAEKQAGVVKRFVTLTVGAGDCDPPYMSTIWHRGAVCRRGHLRRLGPPGRACVALGMLRADLTAPGTEVEVEVFGERHGSRPRRRRGLGPEERADRRDGPPGAPPTDPDGSFEDR